MKFKSLLATCSLSIFIALPAMSQKVDFSIVSVPEETGMEFAKITKTGDYVAQPIVSRQNGNLNWLTNRILSFSPDGRTLAYLSARNNTTNIFLKDITKQGSSVQRTNRQAVMDFNYSPDGKTIVFSENRGKNYQIFSTDANTGYVCRQLTSGENDFSPIYLNDNEVFFCRSELNGTSIWSYDVSNNLLTSYVNGMNPCPVPNDNSVVITRLNSNGKGEIWKINASTGVEECLVSDPNHSYTSPMVSPDGEWIVFVGDGKIPMRGGGEFANVDIFACKTDGTHLTQLTYHAADDLSPVWSRDGKFIYFISQRGDNAGVANIWRMTFNL